MSHLKVVRERQKERETEGALAANTHEAITSKSSGSASGPDEAPEVLNDLGIVHHTRCEIDLAVQKYQEALGIAAGFAGAHNNLGAAYYHRGDLDLAIKEWEQAVRVDSTLAQPRHNLGIAYRMQERLGLAAEAWRSALGIDPHDADAYFGLGEVCETWGESETALENYERFLGLAPLRGDFYVSIAEERIQLLGEKARTGTADHQGPLSLCGVALPLLLA